ncbi:MAG: ribosome small subunit-dependent GTPase A [Bauldia sp.]|nr:ribosome small subunit-dependent GTPase A [Bauldia sp.]
MNSSLSDLAAFGWSQHFQAQLGDDAGLVPARVAVVHRNGVDIVAPGFEARATLRPWGEEEMPTIGDWVLVDPAILRVERVLTRRSLFKRKAAGTAHRIQLLAANVDTVLVVSSCNHDFNLARIERYLALAREAEVEPVVVLTKADTTEDAASYAAEAARLAAGLMVETCDARDPAILERLGPWLRPGQTIVLMGSSGVGKSTLVNTLMGTGAIATAPIREHDSHGRHTTTGRSLHRMATGAWLIDTPGIRELQLTDAEEGIDGVFADIVELQTRCRFHDCRHETEPGCAVRAAIEDGTLDPDRLYRFQKLKREEALNSATLAQRHAASRAFGKHARAVIAAKQKRRDW